MIVAMPGAVLQRQESWVCGGVGKSFEWISVGFTEGSRMSTMVSTMVIVMILSSKVICCNVYELTCCNVCEVTWCIVIKRV